MTGSRKAKCPGCKDEIDISRPMDTTREHIEAWERAERNNDNRCCYCRWKAGDLNSPGRMSLDGNGSFSSRQRSPIWKVQAPRLDETAHEPPSDAQLALFGGDR
jgi:hypothetical protein